MSESDTTLSPRDRQADVLSAWLNAYILEIFCYAAYSVVYMLSVYLIGTLLSLNNLQLLTLLYTKSPIPSAN